MDAGTKHASPKYFKVNSKKHNFDNQTNGLLSHVSQVIVVENVMQLQSSGSADHLRPCYR
jgi:hypothetical protein